MSVSTHDSASLQQTYGVNNSFLEVLVLMEDFLDGIQAQGQRHAPSLGGVVARKMKQ